MGWGYALAYRMGLRPWERYGVVAAASIAAQLDALEESRSALPGRVLDLGCGRGLHTRALAVRGWDAVGVDAVEKAIEQARQVGGGPRYEVADVTALERAQLGEFDAFVDLGCLQGLPPAARRAEGRGVTALANPGADLLVLAFGATAIRRWVGGISEVDVQDAFPAWDLEHVQPAQTDGLGWPMNRTHPRWYRLRYTGAP